AHATPTFNDEGKIISYHSNRTAPSRVGIEYIEGIYDLLLKEENSHADPRKGLEASFNLMVNFLGQQKKSYDEFVLTL
ncbi:MAG: chemotaxis protein, partial [Proteobacteria bacterium]|nr:chemotaxis protein [Pseudomonadota bacterium]